MTTCLNVQHKCMCLVVALYARVIKLNGLVHVHEMLLAILCFLTMMCVVAMQYHNTCDAICVVATMHVMKCMIRKHASGPADHISCIVVMLLSWQDHIIVGNGSTWYAMLF